MGERTMMHEIDTTCMGGVHGGCDVHSKGQHGQLRVMDLRLGQWRGGHMVDAGTRHPRQVHDRWANGRWDSGATTMQISEIELKTRVTMPWLRTLGNYGSIVSFFVRPRKSLSRHFPKDRHRCS